MPCSRGSISTADMRPTVVLSRPRAARKNCVRNCCSGGREQLMTKKRDRNEQERCCDRRSQCEASRRVHPDFSCRRWRFVRRRCRIAVRRIILCNRRFDQRDRHDLVLALEIHQPHALRGAADGANLVGRRAQDLALLGHHEQLFVGVDLRDGDDRAVLVGDLDVLHAQAAAAGDAVLVDAACSWRSPFR